MRLKRENYTPVVDITVPEHSGRNSLELHISPGHNTLSMRYSDAVPLLPLRLHIIFSFQIGNDLFSLLLPEECL